MPRTNNPGGVEGVLLDIWEIHLSQTHKLLQKEDVCVHPT